MNKWINKICCILVMEDYSSKERKEIVTHAAVLIALKYIDRSQIPAF